MSVATQHICHMLRSAVELAEQAEAGHYAPGADTARALERAANLAEYAGAELRVEMLRERDGWPFV